jgi:extradiol dioxygenase family protein
MTDRYIVQLSIPVVDFEEANRFYAGVLGVTVGRESGEWLDILLWGHQITLQNTTSEVLPLERQGKRHFGVVLPWDEWERAARRVRTAGSAFLSEPAVLLEGTDQEQAKFYLEDPSHNIIEIKAYRDVGATLKLNACSHSFISWRGSVYYRPGHYLHCAPDCRDGLLSFSVSHAKRMEAERLGDLWRLDYNWIFASLCSLCGNWRRVDGGG